jgi:hypothetical protein
MPFVYSHPEMRSAIFQILVTAILAIQFVHYFALRKQPCRISRRLTAEFPAHELFS